MRFYSNQSALVAFTVPQKWQPGAGVSIVATHIDSPNLRVSLRCQTLGPPGADVPICIDQAYIEAY